jgi:hypothetical protein
VERAIAYCLSRLKTPFEKFEPQVAVPAYVPAILELVTVGAVPLIEMTHVGKPLTPPRGTEMENVSVEPVRLPERVPIKTVEPESVLAVMVPEMFNPACETVHDIRPGPVLSDADPE